MRTRLPVASLPARVDPCGENGKLHSFARAGPIFRAPVRFAAGDVVYRPVTPTAGACFTEGRIAAPWAQETPPTAAQVCGSCCRLNR